LHEVVQRIQQRLLGTQREALKVVEDEEDGVRLALDGRLAVGAWSRAAQQVQ